MHNLQILGERKYANLRRRPLWKLIPIDLFMEIIASIISSSHERSFGHERRTFVEDDTYFFVEITRLSC
jgi:hypothetical protein